ncbi:vesicle-associated membrane protein 721-like [Camellia sinensis]|uniref:vesicle-associated membrane protein 721-like n=1 Tax=Camellia sinensis TaxID=4442 RepID=UPI001035E30C|nr:vesicle-associated membrane protein 721-like [Camellia sinensis]
MGQQSLIYSFVARGTVVLVEFTGNFTSIASQCLQKLPSSNNKFTYNCDGHTFNSLVEDGFSLFLIHSTAYGYVSSSTLALPSRIKRVFYMSSEGNNLLHECSPELIEQRQ